jgi:hypothetical protein
VNCSRCWAINKQRNNVGLEIEILPYMQMLQQSHDWHERCVVTGRSLFALKKVGDKLSIDRIDPKKGYVVGNMQLLALSLNIAKGTKPMVPQAAINRLLRKLTRVVEDNFSSHNGAIQKT